MKGLDLIYTYSADLLQEEKYSLALLLAQYFNTYFIPCMEACNDFFYKVYTFQISLDVHKSLARVGTLTVIGVHASCIWWSYSLES